MSFLLVPPDHGSFYFLGIWCSSQTHLGLGCAGILQKKTLQHVCPHRSIPGYVKVCGVILYRKGKVGIGSRFQVMRDV